VSTGTRALIAGAQQHPRRAVKVLAHRPAPNLTGRGHIDRAAAFALVSGPLPCTAGAGGCALARRRVTGTDHHGFAPREDS
jgi:hypothetical protein